MYRAPPAHWCIKFTSKLKYVRLTSYDEYVFLFLNRRINMVADFFAWIEKKGRRCINSNHKLERPAPAKVGEDQTYR